MKKAYIPWKPQVRSEHLLGVMLRVLREAEVAPTIGQLAHLMADERVVERNRSGYRKVHVTAQNGRLAGLIDWDAISDENVTTTVAGPHLGEFEVWVSGGGFVPQMIEAVRPWGGRVVVLRGYASLLSIHEYIEDRAGTPIILVTGADEAELRDSVVGRLDAMAALGEQPYVSLVTAPGELEATSPAELRTLVRSSAQAITSVSAERAASTMATTAPAPAYLAATETVRIERLVFELEAAMSSTGETTRAASLKAKVRAAIEGLS